MKITLTGSLGNISKPLATQLIGAGHQVTIISSDPSKASAIKALGATAAIGSVTDRQFLTTAFTGADLVYTMIPPGFGAVDIHDSFTSVGKNYAAAILSTGVKKIVHLSSMGAHLTTGPVLTIAAAEVEKTLNVIPNIAIRHLRNPFFYTNYYGLIGMIKNMGILGSNYPGDNRLLVVHPLDIAAAAAEEIERGFTGISARYVVSAESTPQQMASALGSAIGRPDLPWIEFSDDQTLNGIIQTGAPQQFASAIVENGAYLRNGKFWEDYEAHHPATPKGIQPDSFAKEFAARYHQL